MTTNLPLAATVHLADLAADGISADEPITVWCVLADLLTLASVPADAWPAAVRERITDLAACKPLPAA